MQPAELATRPSTASALARLLPQGIRANQPSTAAPRILWVTPVLHRENPDAARDERLFGWLATRSRGVMLPLEPSRHTTRAIKARTALSPVGSSSPTPSQPGTER